ncbi:aryl-alcohol dehydrogenase-like predicted oxidoreductase [Nonomuraea thailandensis]|uniref:Aryl-alcohol dehydrogenase-like predicted oxidoreductase n=1 Tax=Nonomuraea thailandensis TaxID=1188745 RepID=A0A9X2GHA3_9ACTN|nr:aldo/keto reductase [Nonomuraea thailandensis]MCP2354663.1 aryl-alcohol dehydrogenase-like predicted oxidoreductase [Nonomuraea thailandensis]
MKYTQLGQSGLKVSRLCLGMMSYGDPAEQQWALARDEAEPLVRRAADAGVTFFDTADVYSAGASEVVTGEVLRATFARREDYVLATKVYFPMGRGRNDRGLSRKHILDAIDASLTRLGTDYVDLYQIHRWDDQTPIEETMEALHDVVRAGKARYLGASSMWAWQFAKAQQVAEANGWTRFVSMQNHYNLLYREEEREMLPLCADQGVGVIPWSPLARGVLARAGSATATARTGSDERIDYLYDPENDKLIIDRVAQVAAERGLPAAQIALAWVLARREISAPIVGATKERHVDDAVAAVSVELSEEEIAFLEAPYRPREVRF